MKVGVKILMKKQVLDVQGRVIGRALKLKGHPVTQLNYGRFVQIDIPTDNKEEALQKAHQMTKDMLYNPLVETYDLEILP